MSISKSLPRILHLLTNASKPPTSVKDVSKDEPSRVKRQNTNAIIHGFQSLRKMSATLSNEEYVLLNPPK